MFKTLRLMEMVKLYILMQTVNIFQVRQVVLSALVAVVISDKIYPQVSSNHILMNKTGMPTIKVGDKELNQGQFQHLRGLLCLVVETEVFDDLMFTRIYKVCI